MGVASFNGIGQIGTDIFAAMIATSSDPANNIGVWRERAVNVVWRPVTTYVRFYQSMHKVTGFNNDGYIDSIELPLDGVPLTLVNPGTESASTIGGTNAWGGLRIRDMAPLPHSGTWYFTGGDGRHESSPFGVTAGPNRNDISAQLRECPWMGAFAIPDICASI